MSVFKEGTITSIHTIPKTNYTQQGCNGVSKLSSDNDIQFFCFVVVGGGGRVEFLQLAMCLR